MIAEMRESRGILAKQLAADLEVTPEHLSYVENGHRKSAKLVRKAIAILSAIPKKS